MDFAFGNRKVVVLYVGKQVADVTALLLLVAGHDQAELLFGPRNGNVQQIGIIDEVGYLIVDGAHDDRILFAALEFMHRCYIDRRVNLLSQRIDLCVIWSYDPDIFGFIRKSR